MTLALNRDVLVTEVENGAVILDGRRGRYFQMNSTATTALKMLLAGSSPEQAAARIAARTDAGNEQALRDIQALVDELREAKLVVIKK